MLLSQTRINPTDELVDPSCPRIRPRRPKRRRRRRARKRVDRLRNRSTALSPPARIEHEVRRQRAFACRARIETHLGTHAPSHYPLPAGTPRPAYRRNDPPVSLGGCTGSFERFLLRARTDRLPELPRLGLSERSSPRRLEAPPHHEAESRRASTRPSETRRCPIGRFVDHGHGHFGAAVDGPDQLTTARSTVPLRCGRIPGDKTTPRVVGARGASASSASSRRTRESTNLDPMTAVSASHALGLPHVGASASRPPRAG